MISHQLVEPRKSFTRGGLSTVDLLELTSLDELDKLKMLFTFLYKTSYINEEVNCTVPFPSASIPQFTLTRRSTVLSLPSQLVFLGRTTDS